MLQDITSSSLDISQTLYLLSNFKLKQHRHQTTDSNMTSIVTSMISSTVGLLCDKARDSTAAKLKDGDITDAKIREIVVRELDDIKTKLDGLSRVNLLSSYRFLKEGVELLNVSLDTDQSSSRKL